LISEQLVIIEGAKWLTNLKVIQFKTGLAVIELYDCLKLKFACWTNLEMLVAGWIKYINQVVAAIVEDFIEKDTVGEETLEIGAEGFY